jgi:hypothetical protein
VEQYIFVCGLNDGPVTARSKASVFGHKSADMLGTAFKEWARQALISYPAVARRIDTYEC